MYKDDYPTYSEYQSVLELMHLGEDSWDEHNNIKIEVDKPLMEFLFKIIDKYKKSKKYKTMEKSMKYYLNDTEILKSTRTTIDKNGIDVPNDRLSNAKLNHPLVNKVVNQKVSFLLSKPFTIQTLTEKDNDEFTTLEDMLKIENYLVQEDDKGMEFNKIISKDYFDKKFMQKLKNTGRDAVINGLSWIYVHYNSKGELVFDRIPATNVIPFYRDNDMQELEALCYFYDNIIYEQGADGKLIEKNVTKVKFFNELGIWNYEIEGLDIYRDPLKDMVVSSHYTNKIITTQGNSKKT